ncbi:MAG: IS110 family transposase [Flavobacterium sp.]|nr:IS110 family transposase [Flavobacterium sp.]
MMHPKMKFTYVGIDSHKETHCAVILNCFFEKLGEITFNNIQSEFEDFLNELKKFKVEKTSFCFGMEDTSAYGRALTIFLKKKDFLVKHTNAGLVAHERKSRNSLHKTDSEDAECAARVLLSRFDKLPDAEPDDKYFVLTNLVARRKLIVKMNASLKNHLQSLILSHYSKYDKFFSSVSVKSALAFFEKYPSPSTLEGVSEEELNDFLMKASRNIISEDTAGKILNYVKKEKNHKIDYEEIKNLAIKSTIRQINDGNRELDTMDAILEEFLDHFEYKLTSMKGIDTTMASYLIAEIGNIERFESSANLARYAGVAPVTYASGKSDVQFANKRGNRILATVFYHLAVCVSMVSGKDKIIVNPFFYDYYNKKLAEGKTKRQSLKCVQRRLVSIIYSMMKNKTEYINPPIRRVKKEVEPE